VPGKQNKSERLELLGWILFVISALFFIVVSIRTGDIIGFLGGFFFLIACIAFLLAFKDRGKGN
jgi:uncharacterized membrane protein